MATGGHNAKNPRTTASEPRQRRTWQRTASTSDKEDNTSLNSFPNDLRPNNWDFSDWRPSSGQDQTKRRKKGNPEWEREQSQGQESPPPSERRHGTPRTYPRTKVTPSTPTSQRLALENLRQQITFSDPEDGVSNDGERNNDRNLLRRRENLSGGSNNRADSDGPPLSRPVPNRHEDRNNRNNNKQNQNEARAAAAAADAILGKPDSSQIVGRLMQIRDYIKQASSMMDSLRKSGDPVDRKRCYDLSQLISDWRENESDHLKKLKAMWPGYRDEMDRLKKLMDHLKEQERGYTGLLQSLLSVREEPDVNDATREMTPNLDALDDTTSVDLDVQSEISDREERSISASSRPRIEDKLGVTSDNDMDNGNDNDDNDDDDNDDDEEDAVGDNDDGDSRSNSDLDDTVIDREKLNQVPNWEYELGENELAMGGIPNPREAAETLVALRQQQDLLQKLVEQQEQMRALRGRQASLLAMQQDAESRLSASRQKSNEARGLSADLEDLVGMASSRLDSLTAGEMTNAGRAATDPELQDIRQQLQYLRNELKTQDPNLQQPSQRSQPRGNQQVYQQQQQQQQKTKTESARPKKNPPPRPPSPKVAERAPRQLSGQGATGRNQSPVAAQGASGAGAGMPVAAGMPGMMAIDGEQSKEALQARLQELLNKKSRLDEMLKDEFSRPMISTSTQDMDRDELANKLLELQAKKQRMDDMLKELHSLRASPGLLLNNALPGASAPAAPPTVKREEVDPVDEATGGSEALSNRTLEILDARQKLQKLTEVKGQLSQLKSLVDFYQGRAGTSVAGAADRQADSEDQSSMPAYSDYGGDAEVTRDRPDRESAMQSSAGGGSKQQVNIPVTVVGVDSDENNGSSSTGSESDSEDESQLSSLGPWGDDPEIQEKVRKLKEAKEKLKRLQNLVSIVQESPSTADGLPDNLLDIAASMDEVEARLVAHGAAESRGQARAAETRATQTRGAEGRTGPARGADGRPQARAVGAAEDRNNASTTEPEMTQMSDRDSYYQSKMREQMDELDSLKDEKDRLLAIQNQLQTLHDRFVQAEDQRQKEGEASPEDTRAKSPTSERSASQQQTTGGPSVTFSSNEEVYYKMRNQRMLREELREKKKQLESIMKKDRNRKQYYKNQDNQSDTVSYSTEMFGASASVDQTMATWGGSTVDNMESITEDGAAQDNVEDEDEDDAYPIDGILQVEEEEEENQSDNETYTIEEDVRQRRKARALSNKGGNSESTSRKRTRRSYPRPSGRQQQGGARPKEAWTEPTDFSKWSRSGYKSRQENYRSAEDIVQDDEVDTRMPCSTIDELQQKLEETSKLCQSLLADREQQSPMGQLARQTSAGFGSHNQLTTDLQQQLQQQQLMFSMNQCYQQISMQQMEMQNMQRQIQALLYQQPDTTDINDSLSQDLRARSLPSLFSPMLPRQSPNLLFPDQFQFNAQGYQRVSPSAGNQRLLRRAEDMDQGQRVELGDVPQERQRRTSRQSRTDSYRGKKKSSQSSPQLSTTQGSRSKAPVVSLPDFYSSAIPSQCEEEEEEGFPPDTQNFEDYLARKKKEFFERNKLPDRSTKKTQDTGQRGSLRGSLSSLGTGAESGSSPLYRPGLSAGISGAGYAEDGRSVTSSVQSSVAAVSQANQASAQPESNRDSDDPGEMSLFETLRETIYCEVATLISQNENRPHYLIELFKELQLLTTDYLRQRVLYDIKDVVQKFLIEENSVTAPPPRWLNTEATNNFATSELTPSESLVTSDDEETKYLLQTKLKQKVAANLVAKERQRATQLLRSGSMKNDKYDYQEQADIDSSVSTPSNSFWDSPFNQDTLGETAINLDKTLKKMREYEERLAERNSASERARSGASGGAGRETQARQACGDTAEVSSSAMDQGDESSVNSDSVPYPRIDTQQLDQQIKAIMTEVLPVIKEHMDNMCSPQLLAYIKRLVLSLTRQYDSGQEFARFFHRQLGSILQDTLAKYEGRKMRECGEDLLVDMSEVLFNELAFFRLMQDLDDPQIAEKMKKARALASESEGDDDNYEDDFEKAVTSDASDESDTTESSTANGASDNQDDTRPTQTEEEDLGKARDDEMANEVEIQDAEDKDEDPESPFKGVQIQLAPSETKPYTRIGSDEDDESAESESQSNEDPSETAVSIDARRVTSTDVMDDAAPSPGRSSPEEVKSPGRTGLDQGGKDADQGAANGKTETNDDSTEHMNGDILNGIEVITMDDLPPSLTVHSSEELQSKVQAEQQENCPTAAVLDLQAGQDELAGDPQFLKQPDESSA